MQYVLHLATERVVFLLRSDRFDWRLILLLLELEFLFFSPPLIYGI